MAYSTPQFNLLAKLWLCKFPADGPADYADVPVQKYVRSRMSLDVTPPVTSEWWEAYIPPIQLRFPRYHLAFTGIAVLWTVTVVEVPQGSGAYYRTLWREIQHEGFPNEYALIIATQCNQFGEAIPAPLEDYGVGIEPDVCPTGSGPSPLGWGMANFNNSLTETTSYLVQDSLSSTVLEDTFTDSAGTDLQLHTMTTGPGWYYGGSGSVWVIGSSGSNAVQSSPGTPWTMAYSIMTDHDGEVFSLWTVDLQHDDSFGVIARVVNKDTFYTAWFDLTDGVYELGKVIAGSYISLATAPLLASFSHGDTARVRLALIGSSLGAHFVGPSLGDDQYLTATDTDIP